MFKGREYTLLPETSQNRKRAVLWSGVAGLIVVIVAAMLSFNHPILETFDDYNAAVNVFNSLDLDERQQMTEELFNVKEPVLFDSTNYLFKPKDDIIKTAEEVRCEFFIS